jgi:hypothetical protein
MESCLVISFPNADGVPEGLAELLFFFAEEDAKRIDDQCSGMEPRLSTHVHSGRKGRNAGVRPIQIERM